MSVTIKHYMNIEYKRLRLAIGYSNSRIG